MGTGADVGLTAKHGEAPHAVPPAALALLTGTPRITPRTLHCPLAAVHPDAEEATGLVLSQASGPNGNL